MIEIIKVTNLTQAWNKIGKRFEKEEKTLGGWGARDFFLYLYNFIIESESFLAPKLTLEDVGYTSRKVTHLLNSYINSQELIISLRTLRETSEIGKLGKIFIDYPFPIIKKSLHRKGSCLLSISYKDCWKPTLSICSRAAEFPGKILADIFLISSLAKIIKKILDLKEDINIIWYFGSIFMKARTGARIYKVQKLPQEIIFKNKEFQDWVEKGWGKYIVNQDKASFAGLQRVQKLYLNKIEGNKIENPTNSERFFEIFKEYLKK